MASERASGGVPPRLKSCWVVTDGKVGMESQCIGLAEALGMNAIVKRVRLRAPWRQLTPYFRLGGRAQFGAGSDPLGPPWPDLLIATGRHSVAASLLVRRLSAKTARRTITVQLQNPVIAARHFDLVVVPRHDGLTGANIVATKGALNRITAGRLRDGAEHLTPRLGGLQHPMIGVLIGGSNAAYRLGASEMKAVAEHLAVCAREMHASVLVTPSRRTGGENMRILKESLAGIPHFIWDGAGDNPYFGLLGLADFIVVTADSVNMVSEALGAGKPVYVAELPGGSDKFDRFHVALRDEGLTRPFTGALVSYAYAALDEAGTVAERVKTLLC